MNFEETLTAICKLAEDNSKNGDREEYLIDTVWQKRESMSLINDYFEDKELVAINTTKKHT